MLPKLDYDNFGKITKAEIKWLSELPNTAFMSWSAIKRLVMNQLAIPQEFFLDWTMPKDWQEAVRKESNKRFK